MFDWMDNVIEYSGRALDRLASGENKKNLVMTLIGVAGVVLGVYVVSEKTQAITLAAAKNADTSADTIIMTLGLIGILIFTAIAYINFHLWLNATPSKEREYLDNLELIEKARNNTNKNK